MEYLEGFTNIPYQIWLPIALVLVVRWMVKGKQEDTEKGD